MTTMTPLAQDDEIVLQPVPRRYLAAVVHALADAMNESSSVPASGDDANRPWTTEELKRLKQALSTRPIALALLDLTASLAGGPLTFPELCARTSAIPAKARGELASLSIVAKKHFNHAHWPLTYRWENGAWRYRMSAEMAALWGQA
jgi:hypothetical protein